MITIDKELDEEDIAAFVMHYNMLDFLPTYQAIYRRVGSPLMSDLMKAIQCRFDMNYRSCYYGM